MTGRWEIGPNARALSAIGVLLSVLWGAPASAETGTVPAGSTVLRISADLGAPDARRVTLGLNKAMIVELPVDAQDAIVSQPNVADVSVLTARRVLVFAKAVGEASVFLLARDGRKLAIIDLVVKRDLSDLMASLRQLLKGSNIKAAATGDGLVLSGTVTSPADASRAEEIAQQYLKEGKVVNLITAGSKEQVLLKITVAELQREAIRKLGVNLPDAVTKAGAFTFTKIMENAYPLSAAAIVGAGFRGPGQTPFIGTGTALQATANWNGNSVSAILESFERVGLSRTLAEPTLIAISGEPAKFHAGGEFPIPVAQQNNTISVSWKSFGVNVAFTPFVLTDNRISLKVSAEVSELSAQGAVTLGTLSIPAVQVRKAETVVEMPSGSALAMAGLLSEQTRQNVDGVPELRNLPVLGALFRSKDYKNAQSELVILVTPLIVRPTEPAKLSRPDEGLVPPSPLRGLVYGHLNRVYSKLPPDVLKGEAGFVVDYPEHGLKD